MPNYVENAIIITGNKKALNEIFEKYFSDYPISTDEPDKLSKRLFDFNLVIPIPEELNKTESPNSVNAEEMTEKYGYPDWYKWRIANWGVKWNSEPYGDIDLNDNELLFGFETPWGTPDKVLSELSKKYPDITIIDDCKEEAGFFAGKIIYKNGETDDSDLHPVDMADIDNEDEDE